MKNYSVYIRFEENENLFHTSGVTFQDFISGIDIRSKCLLILAGYPTACQFHMPLLLEYVPQEEMEAFFLENVYNYGDFCWVDFESPAQLNQVSGEELAQLLYMSHMKKPLHDYKISSLGNNYAYLCHDDGWYNNVYLEDVFEYKKVISYLLIKELKGKKRSIYAPEQTILNKLFEMCKDGLVIDFEKKSSESVSLFCVGSVSTMDELENKMDRYRDKSSGHTLYYNARKKNMGAALRDQRKGLERLTFQPLSVLFP